MSDVHTEDLVRDLSRDLEPVRPIPRLRMVVLGVLVLWLLVALAATLLRGFEEELLAGAGLMSAPVVIFAGLTVAGLAGIVAAVGAGVPGRERMVRGALLVALAGMAISAGIGTAMVLSSHAFGSGASFEAHLHCIGVALLVGFLPAIAAVWFAGRAAPYRPLVAVLAAAAGTAALGAVMAKASCPFLDPAHLMLGHILAPAAGAVLLTVPLLAVLRRVRR